MVKREVICVKKDISKKQRVLLKTAGISLAVYFIFRYLLPLVLPFVIAVLLALLIRPVARFLHRVFHIPMSIGAGFVLIILLAAVGSICVWLGQMAVEQLIRLGQQLPQLWEGFTQWIWDGCGKMEHMLDLQEGTISWRIHLWMSDIDVSQIGNGEATWGAEQIWELLQTSLQGAAGFLRILISVFVTVFVTIGATIITTAQWEAVRKALDRSVFGKEIRYISSILARVGVAYGKTQLVIILCTVVISGVGLTILGNPYALLWALVIGVVDALPIFGAGTILWPWLILSLFQRQWIQAIGLAVIYGVSNLTRQWLEARYMGERIGISALENLIAMYVGLKLFGILGLFLGPMGYLLIKETVKREEEAEKNRDKY